ncbi:zinc finger domain-containing protein [Kitasatospora purpeofusca]|uniref:zinc finger domain-containing protein n=1 Tax=Kitasatospora purpeofusca TaxID=67352 RepID=UPI00382F17F2
MTPDQIPKLLAEIALADPRVRRDDPTERRAQAKMWAGILAETPYEFALRAAHEHYRASQWPILPADIATRWTAWTRGRLARHTDPKPAVDPDRSAAWCAELGATRRAVAIGAAEPTPAAIAKGPPLAVAELVAGIGRTPPTRDDAAPYIPADVRQALDQFRTARRAEWTIPCPVPACRARPGDPCTRPSGGRLNGDELSTGSHPSRLDAWLVQQAAA